VPQPEPEPEPLQKKSRSRKSGKADKRKAEDVDDEPPAKRKRGGPGRPKASTSNGDVLGPQQRAVLQKSLRAIFDSLMNLESTSEPESGDEDDGKRQIIGPFITLPHKKFYSDYYLVIHNPICMKMIETKIKKEEYTSLTDLKKDIELMCRNAKTYNEDGSLLYTDAQAIEAACNSKVQDELNEHPELGDFEGSSRDGGSTAPTTSAGTPAAAPPKLKLNFNSSAYGNGGSSAAQSDEEE